LPAGYPRTCEITKRVLSGKNVMHFTDDVFYFGKPLYEHMGIPDEVVPRVIDFIGLIDEKLRNYYGKEYMSNYEDIYFVASQIWNDQSGNYDNVVVNSFVKEISDKVREIVAARPADIHENWGVFDLTRYSVNYINDIVWNSLQRRPKSTGYLSFLGELRDSSDTKTISIFTLNHDLLLEEAFAEIGLDINTGFNKLSNELEIWDPNTFGNDNIPIQLFKLHGSINWFHYTCYNCGALSNSLCISATRDSDHIKCPKCGDYLNSDGRPNILTGTHNKMLEYSSSIYFIMQYHFYRQLNNINRLIISGYSFGDRGINNRIIEWVNKDPDNKIICIHKDPKKLQSSARQAIRNQWDILVSKGQLVFIESNIENLEWNKILTFL